MLGPHLVAPMNPLPYQNTSCEPHNLATRRAHDDTVRHLLASAHSTLEQVPPPSLREILTAYRTRGDGDRDMLLALLNAKTAEDQRLSSVISLQRKMLEIYHASSSLEPHQPIVPNGGHQFPSVPVPHPPAEIYRPSSHDYHRPSRSRSPLGTEMRKMGQEPTRNHSFERPFKRHRLSRSPRPSQHAVYESSHPSGHYPLSPYSSERSDSAEYSPRSRSSMTIGSLLSTCQAREPEDVSRDVSREGG